MLPTLVDNMRITLGWCWTYLIVAEIVAADSGLGFVIWQARRYFKTPEVMAGVIAIGIIGLLTDQIICARCTGAGSAIWRGDAMSYLAFDSVTKLFAPGPDRGRRALRPRVGEGRIRRLPRAVRLRQDHADAHGRRARDADRRARSASRGDALGAPDRRRGMVFQSYSSFPWLTVEENVAFGMRYRVRPDGGREDASARRTSSRSSA